MTVKITIIGLDPLGLSLGLALKRSEQPLLLTAHDREPGRAEAALKQGAVDQREWNLLQAVAGADLVILNESLPHIHETLGVIANELRADAVVTDTAPLKEPVLAWAEALLPPTVHFIGGVPLVTAVRADAELFQKRRYALMPLPRAAEAAVRLVTNVVALLGAEPLYIEAAEHDALRAAVDQLPALNSAALLHVTTQGTAWREMAVMADSSYARATAAAAADPALLALELHRNRAPLRRWLAAQQAELAQLQSLLEADDEGQALQQYLSHLSEARARWDVARVKQPHEEAYERVMNEVKETGGTRRWFSFGRNRASGDGGGR